MTVPILTFYLIGIVLFIIGIEDEAKKERSIIYFGISFFSSYIGYQLSYTDADYTQSAYFPLVIAIFSVVMLIYTAWTLIPHELSFEEKAEEE